MASIARLETAAGVPQQRPGRPHSAVLLPTGAAEGRKRLPVSKSSQPFCRASCGSHRQEYSMVALSVPCSAYLAFTHLARSQRSTRG